MGRMSDVRGLEFFVLTPPGAPDATLAIAASRAGGVGVINLEFTDDVTTALAAVTKLATYGKGRFAILVDSDAENLLTACLSPAFSDLQIVILTSTTPERLSELVRQIHATDRCVYLVVTNLQEAQI